MSPSQVFVRLLGAVPLLLGISLLLFLIIHLAPGGPLDVYADNPSVTPEAMRQMREAFGLDRPLPLQYLLWLKATLTGNWGFSFRTGQPVLREIVDRLRPTIELGTTAIVFSLVVAVPLGAFCAARRGSRLDHALTFLSFAGISAPVFWLGLLLQLTFSIGLGWLPSAGYQSVDDGSLGDRLAHIAMPAAVLSLATVASWSRYVRAGMLDVLGQDYIRTAHAKGRSEFAVIAVHALRNALIPAVTIIALDLASLVSGAVITETVFAWPGVGRLFMESMEGRDYAMLMGLLMMGSAAIIVANIVADIGCALLDPRIRDG